MDNRGIDRGRKEDRREKDEYLLPFTTPNSSSEMKFRQRTDIRKSKDRDNQVR